MSTHHFNLDLLKACYLGFCSDPPTSLGVESLALVVSRTGALGEVEPIALIQVLPPAFDWKRIYSTRSALYLCSEIVKFAHVSKHGSKDLFIMIEIAMGE